MSSLVLGFGCERGIRAAAVRQGIEEMMKSSCYVMSAVELIVSIDIKQDEEGLLEVADELGLDLKFYTTQQLSDVAPPNPNPVVRRAVGVAGVAESAAILASADRSLLKEKTILRPDERAMTLALAIRDRRGGDEKH